MIDFDVIAYTMLGLSLSVSAVQVGGWLLNANPRALLNAGRWSALGLAAMTPLILLGLVVSGRPTLAMMLAGFVLPVFIEGARRWGGRLQLAAMIRRWRPPIMPPRPIDRDLAAQCVALLEEYLAQSRRQAEQQPQPACLPPAMRGGALSPAEAREILGLQHGANPDDVREAHRRLAKRLDPQSGGTRFLMMKINEAKDVLLGL